jgi:hypothetical protein
MQSALLIYGGGDIEYTRPNFVPSDKWHMASKFMSAKDSGSMVCGLLLCTCKFADVDCSTFP